MKPATLLLPFVAFACGGGSTTPTHAAGDAGPPVESQPEASTSQPAPTSCTDFGGKASTVFSSTPQAADFAFDPATLDCAQLCADGNRMLCASDQIPRAADVCLDACNVGKAATQQANVLYGCHARALAHRCIEPGDDCTARMCTSSDDCLRLCTAAAIK